MNDESNIMKPTILIFSQAMELGGVEDYWMLSTMTDITLIFF